MRQLLGGLQGAEQGRHEAVVPAQGPRPRRSADGAALHPVQAGAGQGRQDGAPVRQLLRGQAFGGPRSLAPPLSGRAGKEVDHGDQDGTTAEQATESRAGGEPRKPLRPVQDRHHQARQARPPLRPILRQGSRSPGSGQPMRPLPAASERPRSVRSVRARRGAGRGVARPAGTRAVLPRDRGRAAAHHRGRRRDQERQPDSASRHAPGRRGAGARPAPPPTAGGASASTAPEGASGRVLRETMHDRLTGQQAPRDREGLRVGAPEQERRVPVRRLRGEGHGGRPQSAAIQGIVLAGGSARGDRRASIGRR